MNEINAFIPISESTLRLIGGRSEHEGTVEIMTTEGTYGSICDDYWDIAAAQVVCRVLDYGSAISAPQQSFFGNADGPITLDDVQCKGGEYSLYTCNNADSTEFNCVNSEAAGVVCSGNVST